MFIVEGLPAVILGFAVLIVLCDSPAKAKWLTDRERQVLEAAIKRDERVNTHTSLRDGLASPQVWLFSLLYAALMMGVYGFGLWAPQIIKSLGNLTNQQVGLVLMIPYICATAAMVLWGRHSDRSGERTWHLAVPSLIGAIGFLYGSFADSFYLAVAGFYGGCDGDLRVAATVLVVTDCDSGRHRGGRWHRADQLDRESQRLLRAVDHRQAEGCDAGIYGGVAGDCGEFGGGIGVGVSGWAHGGAPEEKPSIAGRLRSGDRERFGAS